MKKTKKIILVAGARPNFMKVSPVYQAIKSQSCFNVILVHTGQHYDIEMSEIFFKELGLQKPDINLAVGSGSHARQTAKIMARFEKVCQQERPDLVMVVGDVNSTLGCALVAAKLQIPVAHIEAGLRSFDKTMPEEINRLLTDQLSDFLFTTEKSANFNLLREGIAKSKIYFVGNVLIDSLVKNLAKIEKAETFKKMNLQRNDYFVLTLHRPGNVDSKKGLGKIVQGLEQIQKKYKIVFPLHPRTKKNLKRYHLLDRLRRFANFVLLPPLGYLEFLNLVKNSRLVLTDSGSLQEETTFLKVPCLTMRKNTERPITLEMGTNVLVWNDFKKINSSIVKIFQGHQKPCQIPPKWDGKAAQRIAKIISQAL